MSEPDFTGPPPTWEQIVAALPLEAQAVPSLQDRLGALERLTVAIARSDPKTASLADLAAVEAAVVSDAPPEEPIL